MVLKVKQYLASLIILLTDIVLVSAQIDYGFRRSIVMAGLCVIAAIACNEIITRVSKKTASELAVISIVPAMYLLSSLVFNNVNISHELKTEAGIAVILFVSANAIVQYLIKVISSNVLALIVSNVKKHRAILIVIVIAALIRVPFMDILQRWDAGEYYFRFTQAVSSFTYTSFNEYYETFLLCKHPTMAFCLVYAIGEMAFPYQIIGVMIVNMVLTLTALWCIYQIILKIFNDITELRAALYTLIISVLPLFFGTFGYFNLDYALAVFFVYAIYAYVYNKHIMLIWTGILCVQTKETGIVIIAGLLCGCLLEHLLVSRNLSFVIDIFKDIRVYCMAIALCIQFYYMHYIGGVSKWTQTPEEDSKVVWNNSGYNCLGLQPDYIATKLKQQFVLNFNWIFAAVIAAGIIYIIVCAVKHNRTIKLSQELAAIATALCAYTTFSCVYITAAMARYNVVADIMLAVIALYLIDIMLNSRTRYITILVVGVLLLAESYLTIDPITRLVFMNLDTGANGMVYVGRSKDSLYYGDSLVYNSQYVFIDKAFDEILDYADFNEDMDIIVYNNESDTEGIHFAGNTPLYWVYWDSSLRKRVFYEDGTEDINVIYGDDLGIMKELKERAVAVIIPYYGVDAYKALSKTSIYYNIVEEREYQSVRGVIKYYILEKK